MSQNSALQSKDSTKNLILKTARKCFVKKGFAGTSISDIAKVAKINKSLIYHHFENKQHLWISVKQDLAHSFSKRIKEKDVRFDTLKEFLNHVVRERFLGYAHNKDIVQMIHWQALESDRDALGSFKENPWIKMLEDFQETGVVRKDVPADLLLLYVLTAPVGTFLSPASFYHKLPKDQQEAYLAFVLDSIEMTLLPRT
ncbi:uncharacterized protein LOC111320036 [Stylophora pistillata]|uniref:uncharacterized protein LOC111320036 n=1 Tax=Stylophora pistillata TaxID=50429 RepID=UPI000C0475B7|nr:uncharacterized protein LOC111320036 [Stylophora pistillata]